MFKASLGQDLPDQRHKDEAVGKPPRDLASGRGRDSLRRPFSTTLLALGCEQQV